MNLLKAIERRGGCWKEGADPKKLRLELSECGNNAFVNVLVNRTC